VFLQGSNWFDCKIGVMPCLSFGFFESLIAK